MLLPIRTSIRPWRTPYVNYALIAVNVLIFLITYAPHYSIVAGVRVVEPLRPWAQQFELIPRNPDWWQFVSYAFLHADPWHIIFNMFFLYLFGNNVNDRLGHVWYVCFYLAGAVFSGLGHMALHSASYTPTLGASGAVAAVTGAYLVLFPQTLITVLYWFFFIGTIQVPALYFIAFKLILLDNVLARGHGNIAYDAHLAGYGFGIGAVLVLLVTGLTSSSSYDLWAMIKRWNRRRQYRDVVSSGYDPFTGQTARKRVTVREVKKSPAEREFEQRISDLRHEIGSRIAQRNLSDAADRYLELMKLDSKQVLPRQHLLDIANQLTSDKRAAESAQAYEQFLTHYSGYEYAEQVELMLGILYSRYLNQPQQAVKHLQAAAEKLTDRAQLEMCKAELARLRG
jgi:membrane associated rhomboid family serine protease